jgi:CRP-like cAMP-binding protein
MDYATALFLVEKLMKNSLSLNNAEDFFEYKKGQVIYAEGDDPAFVFIIATGKVRLVKEIEGRIIPVMMLKDKDVFGEGEILKNFNRHASAIAYTDCQVVKIKKGDLSRVLRSCPSWVGTIMQTFAERLNHTIDIISENKVFDEAYQGEPLEPNEEVSIKNALEKFK